MDKKRADLIAQFNGLSFGTQLGLGTWLSSKPHKFVLERLERIETEPITKVQLNQLLVISKIASISDGFFQYYWRQVPEHPYDVTAVGNFTPEWLKVDDQVIVSADHLYWGLYR